MKYILNSAVITTPGTYTYKLIGIDEAHDFLCAGEFESTIGYQETADALMVMTGISIPVNRKLIKMNAGDESLVFRLTCRLSDPALKGKLSADFVKQNCEIGILKKED